MADNTKIEWADATLNYANGCSMVSPGCTNCYAMRLAGTRLKHHPSRAGLTQDSKSGPVWTGEVRLNDAALWQALKWKRGRRIFWNAHGDLFHKNVPDEAIDQLFATCALTPQHIHMILTKRSKRMREYFERKTRQAPEWVICPDDPGSLVLLPYEGGWPTNVWLGVSVEDQARADERIPDLLATPAAVRFISAEPLLGPVDLTRVAYPKIKYETGIHYIDGLRAGYWAAKHLGILGRPAQPNEEQGTFTSHSDLGRIDWVIAGGESGPGARPMHPDWPRALRDQCAAAGVPFFFKQWGEWAPDEAFLHLPKSDNAIHEWLADDGQSILSHSWRHGKHRAGRLLDGRTHDAFPA